MAKLETISIVYDNGFLTINKSDFDPEKHQEYKGKVPTILDVPNGIDLNNAEFSELKSLVGTVAITKKLIDNRPLSTEKLTELGVEIDPSLIYFGDYEQKDKA